MKTNHDSSKCLSFFFLELLSDVAKSALNLSFQISMNVAQALALMEHALIW